MKRKSFRWIGWLIFTLMALNIGILPVTAQESCPGEDLFVSEPRGADTETCGKEDEPCQTMKKAVERVESCQIRVIVWYDNGSIEEVRGVFDETNGLGPVKTPLEESEFVAVLTELRDEILWGTLFGLLLGLLAGWRYRKSVQTVGMLLLILLVLNSDPLQAGPTQGIGSCPGTRAYYKPAGSAPTGSDTPTCGSKGAPCASLYYAFQRASSCNNVVNIYRIQNASKLFWAAIYKPPQGSTGNEPYEPTPADRGLAFAGGFVFAGLVAFFVMQRAHARQTA